MNCIICQEPAQQGGTGPDAGWADYKKSNWPTSKITHFRCMKEDQEELPSQDFNRWTVWQMNQERQARVDHQTAVRDHLDAVDRLIRSLPEEMTREYRQERKAPT